MNNDTRGVVKATATAVTAVAVLATVAISIKDQPTTDKPQVVAIKRVVDGDTVEISAPGLPDGLPKKLLLRISGIDTPEKDGKAKCTKEAHLAHLARAHLENVIATSSSITVIVESWDKYGGRVLGDIEFDGKLISKLMIERGYAISYNGEKKTHDWCR